MKQRRSEQTRARIVAAALELLREQGSAGLTMRRLAGRTGLALSNVQYHYRSREALLAGLTEHHLASCREAMVRGVERAGRLGVRTVIEVSLTDASALESASAFRELFALARTEPEVHRRLIVYYTRALSELVALLDAEWPGRGRERLEEAATVVMTSIEGAYLLVGATPVTGTRLAERLEAVVRALLEGP